MNVPVPHGNPIELLNDEKALVRFILDYLISVQKLYGEVSARSQKATMLIKILERLPALQHPVAKDVLAKFDQLLRSDPWQQRWKQLLELETVRRSSIEKRQTQAKTKMDVLKRAVISLFGSGQGYKMTNDEITSFLLDRKLSSYSYGSTLRHVNSIASALRKNK